MGTGTVFIVAVAVTLGSAWVSHDHVLQKLSLLLLLAWAATNLIINCVGFERAPLVVPSIDAFVAVLVAVTGYHRKSWAAMCVFGIYAVIALVHISAFVLQMLTTYAYYAVLYSLFLAQIIIVGAASAWVAFLARPNLGGEWLHRHHARRPRVEG